MFACVSGLWCVDNNGRRKKKGEIKEEEEEGRRKVEGRGGPAKAAKPLPQYFA